MLLFTTVIDRQSSPRPALEVWLTCDQRRRARLRVKSSDGTLIGLMLDRGRALQDGDCLRSEDGQVVARVRAASEHLSRVSTDDPHLLARAAYHLGNRHVPLQLVPGRLAYPHDHVLDAMCRELGLHVEEVIAPFEPETGGYGNHGNGHGHAHTNGHEHVRRAHSHG
jgi:urease accessory protein